MNIFRLIKEDIEDFLMIYRCATRPPDDTNPISQVTEIRSGRLRRKEAELTKGLKKSLELDHEPQEVEECTRCVYPGFVHQKARVLLHDFAAPGYGTPGYVDYYRKKFERGEIEKLEYQYERAHHKMRYSMGFFLRTVSYGVIALLGVPIAFAILLNAIFT